MMKATTPMTDTQARPVPAELARALSGLTLDEKIELLTGHDFWSTTPIEKIGLRRIVVSDGPSGVRGEVWDERDPSLNLPSATALASSWDPEIARRYGAAAAVEARRKGIDVVLGPTINMHRTPYGGRHFEAFSEDPLLTSELAAAYVAGVQGNGVGATLKHYVANDSETSRFTVDARVDERTLREVYLAAFEKAVTEARAWLVMSAYNSVNGATMTENSLLETPLKSEWDFDGVVISDWTAVRSTAAANASQDLAMPGPGGAWGEALARAVRRGEVPEAAIDRKVLRILRLAARVGALGAHQPVDPAWVEDGIAFAREAAIEGTVMLENHRALPWDGRTLTSIAVIGDNAYRYRGQGGGSATVIPEHTVSPLEGLRAALPDADIRYARGVIVQDGVDEFPRATMTNPATGNQGLHVRFLDVDGAEIFSEERRASSLVWLGGDAPLSRARAIELTTIYTPGESGRVLLGFASVGHGWLYADGRLIADVTTTAAGDDLGAALLAPPTAGAQVDLTAGVAVEVRLVFERPAADGLLSHSLSVLLGTRPTAADDDALIAEAAELATASDVVLVVVGTSSAVESEGYDRSTLRLPGRQDDLVAAVAAANSRTVVLVNAGAPVLMPWRDHVAALLIGYFGGQEYGHAIADILLGAAEPGGRLPTTWPADEDAAVLPTTTPTDGVLRYDEGIHIGYRRWIRENRIPAYWFGSGRGYADIDITHAKVPKRVRAGDDLLVEVTVRNTGGRPGKQVVQVYASRPGSLVEHPARWLIAFAPVRVEAGAAATLSITVPARRLAHWADGWSVAPGALELSVGTDAASAACRATVQLQN